MDKKNAATKWMKRGSCRNVAEYIYEKTGMKQTEIMATEKTRYPCPGIKEAADMLRKAVSQGRHIEVVADYDADGIGSAAQMYLILTKAGAKGFRINIPKRMLDGYGINKRIISGIPDGSLVITVDNGISANEAISLAKARGMEVIVLDHHIRGGELPPADLIIDPEDDPKGWGSPFYCGAGLTFKLAECLFPDDAGFLDGLSCFAAISTIADSVNVTRDNRNIILRGLKNLNARRCTEGLGAILDYVAVQKNMEHIGIGEIGFKIAPIFNAPGRLENDGGILILNALFQRGEKAKKYAEKVYSINEKRKDLVQTLKEKVESGEIGEGFLRKRNIIFLYVPDFPEGLCGILAGSLCEDGGRPAFVMTKAEDGSIKGSARSQDGANVFNILKEAENYLTRFGGHEQAAGFSLDEGNLLDSYKAMEAAAPDPGCVSEKYYDLDVLPISLQAVHSAMGQVGVYGVGLPEPVLKVNGPVDDPNEIGEDKTHLSFKMSGVRCIGFGLAEKYRELGKPTRMTVYGTVGTNWYKGRSYVQLHVMDICA